MKKRVFLKLVIIIFCMFYLISFDVKAVYKSDEAYGDYLISEVDKKISLELEGASLINVLKVLSQQTGLNFVAAGTVKDKKITLYMEQVPMKKAMDAIFLANNLTYEFSPESNIFVVKEGVKKTDRLETRIYNLEHARLGGTKLEKEIAAGLGASGKGGIEQAVKNVLTSGGKLVGDPRTNSLIVTDLPCNFSEIEKVINSLDVSIPKVRIEVEMLSVSKKTADKLGFNWSNGFKLTFDSTYGRSFPNSFRLEGPDSAKTGETSWGLNLSNIMQFLHTDINTKILARPEISTLSGETAEIKLTTDEVVNLEFEFDDEGNISEATAERAETGTSLRVTPIVNNSEDKVTLYLHPQDKEAETSGFEYQGTEYKNINEKSVKSLAVLKDGETLMIGGLLNNESSVTETKVPFLGDIPWVGNLFRYENSDTSRNNRHELLVFMTPHIITDGEGRLTESTFTESREQSYGVVKRKAVQKALSQDYN